MRLRRREEPEKAVVEEVQESAAPLLAKLQKTREENQQITSQTEKELRLIRSLNVDVDVQRRRYS